MADISALGNLAPAEAVDMDGYKLSGGPKPFPPKGRYTLRARESFPAEAFGRSSTGALTVQIDPTIASGPHEGFTLRFTRVSNKVYQRGNDRVSQLGDYLKACGITGRLTGEAQDAADKAEQTANLTFDAYVDWRLFAKGEGEGGADLILDGMDAFPKDEKGNPVPYVQSKHKLDEDGNPQILRANLQIKRFVAAQQ
jgi:hypothetical protein